MTMEYITGVAVFNDWIIVQEIGQGATGHVYEIKKNGHGKGIRSALKVIRIPKSPSDVKAVMSEGMTEDDVTDYFKEFVDEILREIKIMVSLKDHPNIVTYEDHCVITHENEIGWDILIKMELLTPLQEWQMDHPMNENEIVRLGCEISSALAYAADHHLIHRDVKPENIFVDSMGRFKLGDFGIARTIEKTTGGLSKKGTESYMAPEVYLGKQYNTQVDIYSLGIVLYRFLNDNRLPFYPPITEKITYSDRETALLKRIQGFPVPEPVNGSAEIKRIVLKACQYLPDDRYQTMNELFNDLQQCEKKRTDSKWSEYRKEEEKSIVQEETEENHNEQSRKKRFHKDREAEDTRTKRRIKKRSRLTIKKVLLTAIKLVSIWLVADAVLFGISYLLPNNADNGGYSQLENNITEITESAKQSKKYYVMVNTALDGVVQEKFTVPCRLENDQYEYVEGEKVTITEWYSPIGYKLKSCTINSETMYAEECQLPLAFDMPAENVDIVVDFVKDENYLKLTEDGNVIATSPKGDGTNYEFEYVKPHYDNNGNYEYETVKFGVYPQSSSTGNIKLPIVWRILKYVEIDGDIYAQMVTNSNLDVRQYDTEENVSWENSNLRNWLNSDFLQTAFPEQQQTYMISGTESGELVTIPSVKDIDKETIGFWRHMNTNYVAEGGSVGASDTGLGSKDEYGWYWIRGEENEAMRVINDSIEECQSNTSYGAVSPMIFVKMRMLLNSGQIEQKYIYHM